MTVSDQFRAVKHYKITNLQLVHGATCIDNKSIPDDDFLLYFQSNSSLIPCHNNTDFCKKSEEYKNLLSSRLIPKADDQ